MAARHVGWTTGEIEAVVKHAMSADYTHLLQTIMANCEEVGEEVPEDDTDIW